MLLCGAGRLVAWKISRQLINHKNRFTIITQNESRFVVEGVRWSLKHCCSVLLAFRCMCVLLRLCFVAFAFRCFCVSLFVFLCFCLTLYRFPLCRFPLCRFLLCSFLLRLRSIKSITTLQGSNYSYIAFLGLLLLFTTERKFEVCIQ